MNAPIRLSFMRFLGLGLEDRVPDARTIWLFREKLTTAGAIKRSSLSWSSGSPYCSPVLLRCLARGRPDALEAVSIGRRNGGAHDEPRLVRRPRPAAMKRCANCPT